MACYLISRASIPSLETIVFTAGPKEKEEAIAVFTDPSAAESYVERAGWGEEYAVATLESIPFLKWLLQAHENGIQYIAVDPDFESQHRGERQNTLNIEAHLEHAGSHILQVARPDF
jgi:hypothetical protein